MPCNCYVGTFVLTARLTELCLQQAFTLLTEARVSPWIRRLNDMVLQNRK